MLFPDLFNLYYRQHVLVNNTRPENAVWVSKHLFRQWAERDVDSITKVEIRRWMDEMQSHSKTVANRCFNVFSAAINWGIERDYVKIANPCTGIKRVRCDSRDRFLSYEEAERFLKVLEREPKVFQDFFICCLFTSARRGNVQAMKWEDLDLTAGTWRIPKTKNGESHTIGLTQTVLDILKTRKKATTSIHVFPGRGRKGYLANPRPAWLRVLEQANITNAVMHDLRRTLPSYLAMRGASTFLIGKVLGHKDPRSTAVYARLHLNPVRDAVEEAISPFNPVA